MAWLILMASAVLEAVWATALSQSDGFSNPTPTIVFFVGCAASMVTLAWAVRSIPIGVGYAVWAGSGAVLTAGWAIANGQETASVAKVVLLAGTVVCIVGLKLATSAKDPEDPTAPSDRRDHASDTTTTTADLTTPETAAVADGPADRKAGMTSKRAAKKAASKAAKEAAGAGKSSKALYEASGFGLISGLMSSSNDNWTDGTQKPKRPSADESRDPRI